MNESEPPAGGGALPLHMLRNGDRAVVVGVQGGHGMQRRMADMGLIPGAEIEVTSDANSTGPVIVRVFEARIAIGRGMARRVMVRPI